MIDPKEIGVPNIQFSIDDGTLKNSAFYKTQRIERGFDDTELWNLDETICSFIYPRLVEFRNKPIYSYPSQLDSFDEWRVVLDKIISAFELIQNSRSDDYVELYGWLSPKDSQIVEEGLQLFAKYLLNLWT